MMMLMSGLRNMGFKLSSNFLGGLIVLLDLCRVNSSDVALALGGDGGAVIFPSLFDAASVKAWSIASISFNRLKLELMTEAFLFGMHV